jgi:hypothetical protein
MSAVLQFMGLGQSPVPYDEGEDDDLVAPIVPVTVEMATLNLRLLIEDLCSGELNDSPKYQRGNVWDDATKRAFIVSILCKRYIPPIVLSDSGNGPRTVIDGKQRLNAIRDYVDNKFYANGLYYSCDPSGRGRVMTEVDAKQLMRTNFCCAIHRNLTEEQELDTFHDLQRGSPLTTGEKIQALGHPTVAQIVEIMKSNPGALATTTGNPRQRDVANATRLVAAIHCGQWFAEVPLRTWLGRNQPSPTTLPTALAVIKEISEKEGLELTINERLAVGWFAGVQASESFKQVCKMVRTLAPEINRRFQNRPQSKNGDTALRWLCKQWKEKL